MNRGASAEDIAKLESEIGRSIPKDFGAFLALFDQSYRIAFFEYSNLGIKALLAQRAILNRLLHDGAFDKFRAESIRAEDPIRAEWWHQHWLPFAEDGGGNLLCLDLDPTDHGSFGQVFPWEIHAGPRLPLAQSFLAYGRLYLEDLRSGKYVYHVPSGTFA